MPNLDPKIYFIIIAALVVLLVVFLVLFLRLYRQSLKLENSNVNLVGELHDNKSSQAQAIHTSKMASLGAMVAGLVHEINTPLGFVRSNVEVVTELLLEQNVQIKRFDTAVKAGFALGPSDPKREPIMKHLARVRREINDGDIAQDAEDLLKDAHDGLDQIAVLIKNLKNFSRLDRDGIDIVDLNQGIEGALTIAHHMLKGEVEIIRDFEKIPEVQCASSQINQVFLNIITNAAQAAETGGKLKIATRSKGKKVTITFTDNGPGIPKDVLPKIFDPFFTTKDVGEGTGLGLSIAFKIIKAHGGSIDVRTAPHKGTTFIVTLPTRQSASTN